MLKRTDSDPHEPDPISKVCIWDRFSIGPFSADYWLNIRCPGSVYPHRL